ncbi:MAG TPA: uroporphyrinogen-III synthase [Cryptosporangiaceae bacterium]|nr:uroporphyrinogen-III synthase [Cryptosporangiaceae bacterium]
MTTEAKAPRTDPRQLAGFTIALTSDRRSEELTASFERRGAQVLHAPTLRIVPLVEDAWLQDATSQVLAEPPDDVVVTTGIGMRGWIEAVDAAGRAPALLEVLGRARIYARGPKARGAIRAAGLVETWAAESETTGEIVDRLLSEGVAGRRVAFQLHGVIDDDQVERLRVAGACVQAVPVYRWGPSPNPVAVTRAIDAMCARMVDAVVFTSAPGAQALLDAAVETGRLDDLVDALSGDVLPAAVGLVTAGPLEAVGVKPLMPDRARLGALVRCVADHLAAGGRAGLATDYGPVRVRGTAAVIGNDVVPLSPVLATILRALVRAGGAVVDRQSLLEELPEASDGHAVEVAVGRLRAALGRPDLVQTVVKRGYRIAAHPAER